jgi:hypothetical protein
MRTISQRLRALAKRPLVSDWTDEESDTHDVAFEWLNRCRLTDFGLEQFYNMSDEEWGMFLYFVAEAMETK